MPTNRLHILALTLLVATVSCGEMGRAVDPEVQNLRAFARLYGYVRFFHPSDEAADIDWAAFAIRGAGRVRSAANPTELKAGLEELFLPIAPTVQIYAAGSPPAVVSTAPDDRDGLSLIGWHHLGVGLGGQGSIYRSKRTNRDLAVAPSNPIGTALQSVDAAPYRGRRIRMRARARADVRGTGNQGQFWVRVDRSGQRIGFFDNMADRPIKSSEWAAYEIEGDVDEDAEQIVVGCFLAGTGRLFVDEFELAALTADGVWEPVALENPGFEAGELGGQPTGWITPVAGFHYQVTPDYPAVGEVALRIESRVARVAQELFATSRASEEAVQRPLGAGLEARIPLTLWGDSASTWAPEGRARPVALAALKEQLGALGGSGSPAADESATTNTRLAAVVIAWNVFQHFYPYFDVVDVDWDAELTRALERTLAAESEEDLYRTLQRLVASLGDGHGNVFHPDFAPRGRPPFLLDVVEGKVVVTRSYVEHVQRADILVSLDGESAEDLLRDAEQHASGSPQWKRFRALGSLGAGEPGSVVTVTLSRNGEELQVEVERQELTAARHEFEREPIEVLEDGIFYVNLDQAEWPVIAEVLDDMAAAPGVVFDLRGYPRGNHAVIGHLLTAPDTSTAWMRIPQIIYPDQENVLGYQEDGWRLPVLEPHIEGTVVFITHGRAISYAESFMSFIEHYGLAEIVGQPTAGANGNINPFALPGGYRVTWTGMRVLKHDGSQHHLVGIQPTVPTERTLAGVQAGRDELLERALEVVRGD
jgi:hypothetical protein